MLHLLALSLFLFLSFCLVLSRSSSLSVGCVYVYLALSFVDLFLHLLSPSRSHSRLSISFVDLSPSLAVCLVVSFVSVVGNIIVSPVCRSLGVSVGIPVSLSMPRQPLRRSSVVACKEAWGRGKGKGGGSVA